MGTGFFEAHSLNKTADDIQLLKDVSLSLDRGSITGIYGSNASSKTVLLQVLAGIRSIDSGEFILEGKNISLSSPLSANRNGIFAVFGDNQLHKNLDIPDNIFLGHYTKTHPALSKKTQAGFFSRKTCQHAAEDLFQYYHCPVSVHKAVNQLTTEEKLLLLIFRCMAAGASILLLDDVFAVKGEIYSDYFLELLQQIARDGTAIILASQDLQRLRKICGDVYFIKKGTLSLMVPSADADTTEETFRYPKLPPRIGPVLYECVDLSREGILHDISLTVNEGEIVAILGSNGSGRTALANMITGYWPVSEGAAYMHGIQLNIHSPVAARRYGISLIREGAHSHGLIPKMSVRQNISLSNLSTITDRQTGLFISTAKENLLTLQIAEKLGIRSSRLSEPASHLSHGYQKKTAFAKTVLSGCQLFLLDEPTKDIDDSGKIQIYSIMTELVQEGNGILLFTSDIHEALGMCDRIYVLHHHTIEYELLPNQTSYTELHDLI